MKNLSKKSRRTPAADILTQVILETFRLNGRLITIGDRLTRDLDLTTARWQVLGSIVLKRQSVSQIARNRGLKRQSVQRVVNSLVESGLAKFVDNPAHRKAKLVDATQQGRRRFESMTARQSEWANQVARELTLQELNAAMGALQKLNDAVK